MFLLPRTFAMRHVTQWYSHENNNIFYDNLTRHWYIIRNVRVCSSVHINIEYVVLVWDLSQSKSNRGAGEEYRVYYHKPREKKKKCSTAVNAPVCFFSPHSIVFFFLLRLQRASRWKHNEIQFFFYLAYPILTSPILLLSVLL